MSVGPLGAAAGFAGTPLAQTHGSEAERTTQQARAHERRVQSETKAADAAGVAASDSEDNQPQERDGDGRRLWERPLPGKQSEGEADESVLTDPELPPDPRGESGTQLDLSG